MSPVPITPPRNQERAAFSNQARLLLLEQDADRVDAAIDRVDAKLNWILWSGIAFTIALVLNAIAMAVRL